MEEDSSSDDEESNRPSRPTSRQPGRQPKLPGSSAPPPPPQPLPLPPSADKVLVKKGYDPKQGLYDHYYYL